MARTLTDKGVAALKPRAKLYNHGDPQLPGHMIRVMPSGTKAFFAVTRDPRGKQVWITLGKTTSINIDAARDKAREVIARVKAGQDVAGPLSFQAVAEQWLKRHVEANALRSAGEIRNKLNLHVLPSWGGRDFATIKRGDVAALLDHVEDNAGPVAADKVLAFLSGLFNWYATRHDDFSSPIIRGMRRSKPAQRARSRILDDDELRAVWKQAEANGTFGALVRLLLLTGQRREKVQTMRWQDVDVDGVWTIPAEKREKGTARELQLPEQAISIIQNQPRFASNPYALAGRRGYYNGVSKGKVRFLKTLPPMPQWGLHDLRRTARSLMARAGVAPLVAELVLGHAQKGVAGIYDRHAYATEKGDALRKLASLIDNIVHPVDRVVHMRGRRRRR